MYKAGFMTTHRKNKHRRVGRPRKEMKRSRVNITLDPTIGQKADRIAFNSHRSLSGLVELCLRLLITQVQGDPESSNLLNRKR